MRKSVSFVLFLLVINLSAQSRIETDLSGKGWKLIQDKEAQWKNDPFFLPPVVGRHLIKIFSESMFELKTWKYETGIKQSSIHRGWNENQ